MRVSIPIAGNPLSPRPSGIMSFVLGLARYLVKYGVPVELLGTGESREGEPQITGIAPDGCTEWAFAAALGRYLAARPASRDTLVVANTELYVWALRHVSPSPIVVLILHGPTYPTLKQRRQVAGALFVHLVEPRALSLTRSTVTIDAESSRYVSSKYPRAKITQIPLPVDTEHFRPYSRPKSKRKWGVPNRPCLLFTGRLAVEKDPVLAIRVHRILLEHEPDLTLLVAGTGPLAQKVESMAHDLGEKSVLMLGAVPRIDLPELYSAADSLLITSRIEQLPNVALESLACGTQVVSTDVGELRSVLANPNAGVVVRGGADELAREVAQRVPETDDIRNKYTDTRRQIAEQHSWERLGPRLMQVFHDALSS